MTNATTTKIVINECYGGFSLSSEAIRAYLTRKGWSWTEEAPERFASILGPSFYVDGENWYDRELDRTDADLVAVVEELGEAANGRYAELAVKELRRGTAYLIDEYDGLETLQTREDTDWSIA